MSAWEVALLVVAINWGAPLLLWLYPLVMTLVFKDFVFDGFYGPWARFKLVRFGMEPWHARMWRDWCGAGFYGFMCYRSYPDWTKFTMDRLLKHEATHCRHWAIFGLHFWFLYVGHTLWIFVTQRLKGKPYTKHPYYDCWSERLARKAAGQSLNIPPEQWPGGKDDLWPWS